MSRTNFRDYQEPTINAAWLNKVDQALFEADSDLSLPELLAAPGGTSLLGHTQATGAITTLGEVLLKTEPAVASVGNLVQVKRMEPFLGFNNGTTDTSVFPGFPTAVQGLAYLDNNGTEEVYITQNAGGTSYAASERKFLCRFDLKTDGSLGHMLDATPALSVGHQTLSAIKEGDQVKLYTAMTTEVGHEGTDCGKGYSVTTWKGAATAQGDVRIYQLFGYAGSGHRFASYYQGCPVVSDDGKFIIVVAKDLKPAGPVNDLCHYAFVYSRAEVEAAADPLTVNPLHQWLVPTPKLVENAVLQGVSCDGRFIYLQRGLVAALASDKVVQIFDLNGTLIKDIAFDGPRAIYGLDGILNNATLGNPIAMEAEDLAVRKGEILVQVTDFWMAGCPIVTWQGLNWASRSDNNLGIYPSERDWVRTTKAATHGAWNPLTTYSRGTNYTRRSVLIYAIKTATGENGEQSLEAGITDRRPGASFAATDNGVDFCYLFPRTFSISAYAPALGKYFNSVQAAGGQWRVYDTDPSADNTKYSLFGGVFNNGRQITNVRACDEGVGFNLYGAGDSTFPNDIAVLGPSGSTNFRFTGAGVFRPSQNEVQSLGSAAYRFLEVYGKKLYFGSNGCFLTSMAGTPEGSLTAPPGSVCVNVSGTATTMVYIKATGTGNTGWVAIF